MLALLALAATAAHAAALSHFAPAGGACDWRLLDLEAATVRTVASFEVCPEAFAWTDKLAVAASAGEVWSGDWTSGTLARSAPPPPLPTRGRVEKAGFDAQGRTLLIVSDEFLEPPADETAPTHSVAAYALQDGGWRLLLREKAGGRGRPPLASGLSSKFEWTGADLASRLERMRPKAAERLAVRGADVFILLGKSRTHLMPKSEARRLEAKALQPGAAVFYGAVPIEPPVRYVFALAQTGRAYAPPVWSIDVERGGGPRPLDEVPRETVGLGIDAAYGHVLTAEQAYGRHPKVFRGLDFRLVFEDREAKGAAFFP